MRYIIAITLLGLAAWPFLIWIVDGKFTPAVWQTAAVLWGIPLIGFAITKFVQKKKLW